jgi:predicted TPR repeat methyltransferase
MKRYVIQFPRTDFHGMDQDESWFHLVEGDARTKLRFHDYAALYARPGLYEQLYYDRLKCTSPSKVRSILESALRSAQREVSQLRVLDLGAGNGMMGEELKRIGVARLVGVDIVSEARDAALRDRPDVYDEYYVTDLTQPAPAVLQELQSWGFDAMTSVAALGFGDIPPRAFLAAMNLVREDGWVAFNVKETFLGQADRSGFSRLVRALIADRMLDVHHLERYRHRLSIEGEPLYYFALVARKGKAIDEQLLARLELDATDR